MRLGNIRWGRRMAAAVLGLAVVATTAGCGGGSGGDGKVTLRFTWWGNADRAEVTQKVIDLFEAENPKIKIETSYSEFDAYWEKMATQFAGGGGPDILTMDYRYIREYADRHVLAEINGVNTTKMSPNLLSSGKIDGKTYAIPVGQTTQALLYDPKVWKSAGEHAPKNGWTWSDLETGAAKVSDASGGKVRGVTSFGQVEDWFEVWLRQHGKTLYTAGGKLGYTAADLTEYWELAERLRTSGAATQAAETTKMDGSQANSPLAKKTSAAEFNYDSGLTATSWEIYGRPLELSTFPSNGSELGQYAKPSMLLSISRRSKHPKEAAKFVDFLLNDAKAGTVQSTSRGMPANSDVRTAVGKSLTGPPRMAYDFEAALLPKLTAAPPPPPKGAGAVKSALQRIYDDVMFERSTPQKAAEDFIKEAERAIER
jgi:multiple sugar transport system substrate-binding protein